MAKKKTRVVLPGGIQGLVHDLQNGTSTYTPRQIVSPSPNDTADDNEDTPPSPSSGDSVVSSDGDNGGLTATAEGVNAQRQNYQTPEITVRTRTDADEELWTQMKEAGQAATEEESADTTVRTSEVMTSRVQQRPASTTRQPIISQGRPAPDTNEEGRGRGRRPKENTMKEYSIVKDDSADSWELFIDMAQQYKTGGGKLATIYIDESLKSVLDRMKYAGTSKLSTSAILSSIVARFIYDHEDDIRNIIYNKNLF